MKKPEISRNHSNLEYLLKISNSYALNAGYNLEKLLKIPLSIGIGYANANFKFYDFSSPSPIVDEASNAYNAYSIGIGLNYNINFSAGITYKRISSELFPGTHVIKDADGNEGVGAFDFGFFLNVPLIDLALKEFGKSMENTLYLVPSLVFSAGYSQSNIGDKAYYFDYAQANPLPRTARAGYGISAGVRLSPNIYDIGLFHIDFASEAEDYLIVRDSIGNSSYQSGFGDITLGRNILGIKGDEHVYAHTGLKISILESVEFMWGHMGNRRFFGKTKGFGLRAKGLFRYLSDQRNNEMMNFIADHIDIRYYATKYRIDAFQETSYSGIELEFSNYLF